MINEDTRTKINEMFGGVAPVIKWHLADGGAVSARCESPIEQVLSSAFTLARIGTFTHFLWNFLCVEWHLDKSKEITIQDVEAYVQSERHIHVAPQVSIEGYRVDFLAAFKVDGVVHYLAIECDGHDFHERTKEQAKKDKSRDRVLLSIGIPVMRFTGSEVWANPWGCVEQVFNYYLLRDEPPQKAAEFLRPKGLRVVA